MILRRSTWRDPLPRFKFLLPPPRGHSCPDPAGVGEGNTVLKLGGVKRIPNQAALNVTVMRPCSALPPPGMSTAPGRPNPLPPAPTLIRRTYPAVTAKVAVTLPPCQPAPPAPSGPPGLVVLLPPPSPPRPPPAPCAPTVTVPDPGAVDENEPGVLKTCPGGGGGGGGNGGSGGGRIPRGSISW